MAQRQPEPDIVQLLQTIRESPRERWLFAQPLVEVQGVTFLKTYWIVDVTLEAEPDK